MLKQPNLSLIQGAILKRGVTDTLSEQKPTHPNLTTNSSRLEQSPAPKFINVHGTVEPQRGNKQSGLGIDECKEMSQDSPHKQDIFRQNF